MKQTDPTPLNEIQQIIEETSSALGGTENTYIQLLLFLQKEQKLSVPNRLLPGQLIFFNYKPISDGYNSTKRAQTNKKIKNNVKSSRTKDKYYDIFPLVFVTETHTGGFEGVNLHFLDPDLRKFLFDSIMEGVAVIGHSKEEWRQRLLLDYERLDSRKQFRYFRPCYRRYSWKGMKKRPVVLPFDMWEEMAKSEISRFKNASRARVYKESFLQVMKASIKGK